MAIRAAVLAGGAASRFSGRPKGLERVGGERILDRVVQTVQEALGTPPMLVANAPAASGWRDDLAVTPDPTRCWCSPGTCRSSPRACYEPWWMAPAITTSSCLRAKVLSRSNRCADYMALRARPSSSSTWRTRTSGPLDFTGSYTRGSFPSKRWRNTATLLRNSSM